MRWLKHVHFRLDWSTPRSVGRKAIAVSLSDLAAMGAAPRAVLVSLTLPAGFPLADFDALVDGLVEEAGRHGATLAGGNIATSPGGLAIHVTALGSAHPRRILTRAGGRAGDELFVTGTIGAAAAGLGALHAGGPRRRSRHGRPGRMSCAIRDAQPAHPLRDAAWRVSAPHRPAWTFPMAWRTPPGKSPRPAARECASTPPCCRSIRARRRWFEARGLDPIAAALAGGEDYELLFAVPRRKRRGFLAAIARSGGIAATRIGELTSAPALVLRQGDNNLVLPAGYSHLG